MYSTINFESVSVGLIIVFKHVGYHRIDQFIHLPVRGSHQRSNSYYQYKTTYLYCQSLVSWNCQSFHIIDQRIIQYNTRSTYVDISANDHFHVLNYFQKYHCFLAVNLNSILLWYQTAVWEVSVKYQLDTNSAWN